MNTAIACALACALAYLLPASVHAQVATTPVAQNPSPMVESTRPHERLVRKSLDGREVSFAGPAGRSVDLYIPKTVGSRQSFDLLVHFHGEAWLPKQAAASLRRPPVVAVLNLGAGSGVYDRAFTDPAVFDSLQASVVREVSAALGHSAVIGQLTLAGFSAGHGAIRAILREPRHLASVSAILLMDGMHTSYVPDNKVLASGATIDTTNLTAFASYARAAAQGGKRFLVTHSEIFPGTFVSTTEAADWLLQSLGLSRRPVLRWGPRGMQQLSEVRQGHFTVLGFAGNSAPDHIDQLHAMPEMLARLLGR